MAVNRLPSGKYQTKVRGTDGHWLTKAFPTRREAETYEAALKQQKGIGFAVTNIANQLTLDVYFDEWYRTVQHQATPGWRRQQRALYQNHIRPGFGQRKMAAVTPQVLARILGGMAEMGYSEATRLHVFVLVRKLFNDAVELFRIVQQNPAIKSLRPRLPVKEARHLGLAQIRNLLEHVRGKPCGLAVWLGAYLGLRVGEIQALRWSDLELDAGIIHVRRAYSKHDVTFRDYPKGRRQHSHKIPRELLEYLREESEGAGVQELVVVPEGWSMLDYWDFLDRLKAFCREAGVQEIGTHGLRHSSAAIWLEAGASRDDLRSLLAHTDPKTTDRYIHHHGSGLERAANVIELFPNRKCSMDVPRSTKDEQENRVK